MSQITTHILDTTRGLPAQNVPITLFTQDGEGWKEINGGVTNTDGRLPGLLAADEKLPAGIYRMHFATSVYFKAIKREPYIDMVIGPQSYHKIGDLNFKLSKKKR